MKRVLLLFVLLNAIFDCHAQESSHIEKGQSFIFQGEIDQYPITLIFELFDKKVHGRYFYQKVGTNIDVIGEQTDSGFNLTTIGTGLSESEIFTLKYYRNELIGKWKKHNKKRVVELYRKINPIDLYRYHKSIAASDILQNIDPVYKTDGIHQEAELSFVFVWPNGSFNYDASIRKSQFLQLQNFQLGQEASSAIRFDEPIEPNTLNGSPKQLIHLMERISDSFFNQFRQSIIAAYQSGSIDYFGSQRFDITNLIQYHSEKFNVIQTTQSEFTGGAHGNYFQYHTTWNAADGKKLNLEDLLSKNQIKKLPKIMTRNYKTSKGIPQNDPLDKHGLWITEFEYPGGNMYFTDQGIHTAFTLYEIAPYSEGLVPVFVSWNDLK